MATQETQTPWATQTGPPGHGLRRELRFWEAIPLPRLAARIGAPPAGDEGLEAAPPA